MKTIMKYFGLITLLMLVSTVLSAQPQAGDCVNENNSYRAAKTGWIVQPKYTPFNGGQLDRYDGLDYYDIDCEYTVKGSLEVNSSQKNVPTTNGKSVSLLEYGTITCRYDGNEYTMIVYKDNKNNMPEFKEAPGTYFIPFKDPTNLDPSPATGSWDDGRYLIIEIPAQGKQVTLDFNQAINPFIAYRNTSAYTTLVISGGNEIEAPVPVGERKYEDRTK